MCRVPNTVIGGLKVGASVTYENAFEVSQLQKQLAVALARICLIAISIATKSE
jgi:hypothetical protein